MWKDLEKRIFCKDKYVSLYGFHFIHLWPVKMTKVVSVQMEVSCIISGKNKD